MHVVELCAGSASLALHLLGARKALLPYQGSKWRFRKALAALLPEGTGPVTRLTLTDPGPWGQVLPQVVDPAARAALIAALEALAAEDPRTVYERLNRAPAARAPVRFAAEFLFLQRLAFSGKAVGLVDGCWSSPGFNTSSAYGLPGTARFGKVNPMVPSLIRVLRGYDLRPVALHGGRRGAAGPPGPVTETTLVYLDPPYAGSTRYPNGDLDRDAVVGLARAWRDAGAEVWISEGEPIDALVAEGWQAVCLTPGRGDTSPFRGKQAEWVTRSPPASDQR